MIGNATRHPVRSAAELRELVRPFVANPSWDLTVANGRSRDFVKNVPADLVARIGGIVTDLQLRNLPSGSEPLERQFILSLAAGNPSARFSGIASYTELAGRVAFDVDTIEVEFDSAESALETNLALQRMHPSSVTGGRSSLKAWWD